MGQGFIEGENIVRWRFNRQLRVVHVDSLTIASVLHAGFASGLIHEDLPHGLGCRREEVPAAAPVRLVAIDEPQVGLMDQSRCLQRVAWWDLGHPGTGQSAELGKDQGKQIFSRFRVALRGRLENLGHLPDRLFSHSSNPHFS